MEHLVFTQADQQGNRQVRIKDQFSQLLHRLLSSQRYDGLAEMTEIMFKGFTAFSL